MSVSFTSKRSLQYQPGPRNSAPLAHWRLLRTWKIIEDIRGFINGCKDVLEKKNRKHWLLMLFTSLSMLRNQPDLGFLVTSSSTNGGGSSLHCGEAPSLGCKGDSIVCARRGARFFLTVGKGGSLVLPTLHWCSASLSLGEVDQSITGKCPHTPSGMKGIVFGSSILRAPLKLLSKKLRLNQSHAACWELEHMSAHHVKFIF